MSTLVTIPSRAGGAGRYQYEYPNNISAPNTNMLGGSTLTTLPFGVGEHVIAFLPPQSVATLQRVSKKIQTLSKLALIAHADALPNAKEILSLVDDMSAANMSFSVVLLQMPTQTTPPQVRIIDCLHWNEELIKFTIPEVEDGLLRVDEIEDVTEDGFTKHSLQKSLMNTWMVDPDIIYRVLNRRESCKTNIENYAMEMTIQYAQKIMTALLLPLTTLQTATELASGIPITSKIVATVPTDEQERIEHLFGVLFVAEAWFARAFSSETYLNVDELLAGHTEAVLENLNKCNPTLQLKEDLKNVKSISPLSREVQNYVKDMLNRNKPFRIALFSKVGRDTSKNPAIPTILAQVKVLCMTDATNGEYTVYTEQKTLTGTKIVVKEKPACKGIEEILSSKQLGVVDITSARQIECDSTVGDRSIIFSPLLDMLFIGGGIGTLKMFTKEQVEIQAARIIHRVSNLPELRQMMRHLAMIQVFWHGAEEIPELTTILQGNTNIDNYYNIKPYLIALISHSLVCLFK